MNKKLMRYLLRLLWAGFLITVTGVPAVFLMVKNDAFGWFGGLPSLQAL